MRPRTWPPLLTYLLTLNVFRDFAVAQEKEGTALMTSQLSRNRPWSKRRTHGPK